MLEQLIVKLMASNLRGPLIGQRSPREAGSCCLGDRVRERSVLFSFLIQLQIELHAFGLPVLAVEQNVRHPLVIIDAGYGFDNLIQVLKRQLVAGH